MALLSIVSLVAACLMATPRAVADAADPVRILLVGDSVTQTSYRLTWWPVGKRSAAARTRTVAGTSTRIGSLSPRRRYAVTVGARNGTGAGPVSEPAIARPGR